MPGDRLTRVLDAAYECFTKHGIRKTTMDDIAAAAGMSRPAVYQYVRNKDDAFRRLAGRIFDQALDRARAAATAPGTLTQRMDRVLAVKLDLTQRMCQDTPYGGELIGRGSTLSGELDRTFAASMTDLLSATITEAATEVGLPLRADNAREVAELALALTRGLEADLSDPDRPRQQLHNGVALLVAGLAAAAQPPSP
jgi:TetR/AcrR family transcriptional regulator